MVSVCLYFQVHQPYRLKRDFDFFAIGGQALYEDEDLNASIVRKVAQNCYLPTNKLMLELIKKHEGKFKISFSMSGLVLDQFEQYCPEVITSFKELVDTGCVEILSETYYHSLAFLYSKNEFIEEVKAHKKKIKTLFGVTPKTFRNTELVYNNDLAKFIEDMGYQTILAEGAPQILGWRTPNFVYQPAPCYKLSVLLKNFKLSDDVAFRFSDKGWADYPLTAEKYASWIHGVAGGGEVVNLFMDYETFGEHQSAETGIFEFLKELPTQILKNKDFAFQTPSEVTKTYQPMSKIDVPNYVSWADSERDLSAWLGNSMQDSASEFAYQMEDEVLKTKDADIIHAWRKLLASDHFYYMCTKWFCDGDVHKYFNPFNTPYDAFICYTNAINHLKEVLKKRVVGKSKKASCEKKAPKKATTKVSKERSTSVEF